MTKARVYLSLRASENLTIKPPHATTCVHLSNPPTHETASLGLGSNPNPNPKPRSNWHQHIHSCSTIDVPKKQDGATSALLRDRSCCKLSGRCVHPAAAVCPIFRRILLVKQPHNPCIVLASRSTARTASCGSSRRSSGSKRSALAAPSSPRKLSATLSPSALRS